MEIVEFDTCCITSFEHFHLNKCCDVFDVTRCQAFQEPEHQFAPRPEIVLSIRSATLGKSGHGMLESMRMNVGRGGEKQAGPGAFRGVP